MGLQHRFCIPAGRRPAEGACIADPLDDLVGILALERQRQRCLVVGEDLGSVPEGFRERMADARILSCRILVFEQEERSGAFLPPEACPPPAPAVLGRRNLPTLRGWREGRDIHLKARDGLRPGKAEAAGQRATRLRDRAALLRALRAAGLLDDAAPDIAALSRAAHAFLARRAALRAVAQVDAMADQVDPVNVPSGSGEHPNWRRRPSVTPEELPERGDFAAVAAILSAVRPRG